MLKFSAALICAALSLAGQPLANQGLSGRRAPSFALPDSRGQAHDILDARGHWLLIDFMKTDCPHCKELSKKLEGVRGRFGSKVEVFSILMSPPETVATVAKYVQEQRITSPFLFDYGQVAINYFRATPANPTFDTPHLFAVDPNGIIVRDWSQAGVEAPGFLSELEQLLNKK
jgi:peroxiredoxin